MQPLAVQDKALVICVGATVHTDARFSELRHLWEKGHHCQLKKEPTKVSVIKVPGVFSASGAPTGQ